MKKILWLCPLMLLIMAFIGCDDKEKDDDEGLGGQLSETTWAAEVKKYPFLTNFPEYDGELENHRYDDTYGILQYIIMDYKCEESLKTKYCAKLTAAGFVVGQTTSNPVIASLGTTLGKGTLTSIVLVMLILPQLLYMFDGIIAKTYYKSKLSLENLSKLRAEAAGEEGQKA